MSGTIEYFQILVLILSLIAILTDLLRGKIYNWLTLSFMVIGVVASGLSFGWTGVGNALLAIAIAFILFGWMYVLGFMGGGDVKLLMAFGALGGLRYAEEVAIISIFLGGIFSLIILIFKGKLVDFIHRMGTFLLSVFIRELEVQLPTLDSSLKMPFGVPLSLAAIWVAYAHPLEKLGLLLWP